MVKGSRAVSGQRQICSSSKAGFEQMGITAVNADELVIVVMAARRSRPYQDSMLVIAWVRVLEQV